MKNTIKTHLNRNGIVVFELKNGRRKTVEAFGYGLHHKIWYRITGLASRQIVMNAEVGREVKEKIVRWVS